MIFHAEDPGTHLAINSSDTFLYKTNLKIRQRRSTPITWMRFRSNEGIVNELRITADNKIADAKGNVSKRKIKTDVWYHVTLTESTLTVTKLYPWYKAPARAWRRWRNRNIVYTANQ